MSIDWTDPRAPSRQIADALGDDIRRGVLPPGSRLPSERDLVARYGTAPQTARQAVSLLKSEGLVVGLPGRGIFVRERRSPVRVGSDRYQRWLEVQSDDGSEFHPEELERAEVAATERVAEGLEVPPGETVFVLRRRIWLGDAPTQLDDSYYPLDVAREAAITEQKVGTGSSHSLLQSSGHRVTRVREDISLRMPTPDEVRRLKLSKGVPVADLFRVSYTDDGPVEVFTAVLDGDRHVFSYAFAAPA